MAAKHAGRSTRRFKQMRANLRAISKERNSPCILCGQSIDYNAEWPDPNSFSTQHIKDWISHPELREDPANLGPAHLLCNQARVEPGLGEVSSVW